MPHLFQVKDLAYEVADKEILKDIQLIVNQGEDVVISGPSGSGKSTLLKLLGSLLTPTAGQLTFEGRPIKDIEPTEYRKAVSYCFQNPQLFGETVKDNLVFPYEIRQQTFDEERSLLLLEQIGLSADFLTQPINGLSGGEKQRVGLIRHLQIMPKVLLLDEVTSALDRQSSLVVRAFLKKIQKDHQLTLIRVTHVQEEIEQATRLVKVVSGRIVE
ncbi:ATP-binding cassette domain-containing protein [Vagococcus sp. BWB3-3]|uniref:ATP-binding cassette domain-containing protein n=1 Tax=Vagococcus allomyrinae TaxID=2794353 RepID=A0A940P5M5_9ENTE|nr:ATP-binding cassette domain-containing protein [Vagococcus allomyrinae]